MLVKQYASLLTFVYLFKWNRQMERETVFVEWEMRDNNMTRSSLFLFFFTSCVKVDPQHSHLSVIECNFLK